MNRLLRYACLLVSALWLPATMHCSLEAAGVLETHCQESECRDVGSSGCTQKVCKTLEDSASNTSRKEAKAPAPVVCAFVLCRRLILANDGGGQAVPLWPFVHPLDWVPAWHFERRSASLPRTPSDQV